VTIATPFLADELLATGRLSRVGTARASLGVAYHVVCPTAAVRRRPDVRAFAAWLHTEAEPTLRAFDAY
jgi:hypothetical protein